MVASQREGVFHFSLEDVSCRKRGSGRMGQFYGTCGEQEKERKLVVTRHLANERNGSESFCPWVCSIYVWKMLLLTRGLR
jgi:hypothetical protein